MRTINDIEAYIDLAKAMEKLLSNKEIQVVLAYYGFNGPPITQKEIGDQYLGISHTRVGQIKRKALKTLRNYFAREHLRSFADVIK